MGVAVELSKCNFSPSQQFTALGVMWDTVSMRCSVPVKRIKNIISSAARVLNRAGAGARAGTFNRDKSTAVRTRVTAGLGSAGGPVHIDGDVHEGRQTQAAAHSAATGHVGPPKRVGRRNQADSGGSAGSSVVDHEGTVSRKRKRDRATASSNERVGDVGCGYSQRRMGRNTGTGRQKWTTRGFFTKNERSFYMNNLELLGNRKTVESLLPLAVPRSRWHLVHLQCELDNVAAIKCGKVGVSRSLGMSILGADYHDWRGKFRLSIGFQFLAGVLNVESDGLSRWEMNHREWQLEPRLFREVCRRFRANPEIDFMASRQNAQTKLFFSCESDCESVGTNCFHARWNWKTVCAHPPPTLVGRGLQHLPVRRDRAPSTILIVPV
jgi:hypothetical protein